MSKPVPDGLKDHVLPFNWDVRKVWELDAAVVQTACSAFAYLLQLPLWSSVPGQGLLFDVCPIEVIRNPGISTYQAQRLRDADLRYPVDVLVLSGRGWILDGVHRVARHIALNASTLPVRFHDESVIPAIMRQIDSVPPGVSVNPERNTAPSAPQT